jgi:hypothetical protein
VLSRTKKEGTIAERILINELKRATDKTSKEYSSCVCEEIMEFKRRGRCDLNALYQRTKKLV